MNRIEFIEPHKTDALWKDGYVVFPLLDKQKVDELRAIFYQFHPKVPSGFYASTHLEDIDLRKKMSDAAMKIISPEVKKWLRNGWLLGGAFISKSPGESGVLPLHQDWNLVDETRERSYNLWIPLVDVNEVNGAMRILPSSHNKQKTIRGPKIRPVLESISSDVDKYMQSLNMKEGEVVLYDHALWHSSPINQSNELRIALVLGMVPLNAELRYYEMDGSVVSEYESYPEFFMENNRDSGGSKLNKLRDFELKNQQLSLNDFHRIYLGSENQLNSSSFFKSLYNRLFK